MAMRVTLVKDGTSAGSIYPRVSRSPYLFITDSDNSGSITIEQSVDGMNVADADADWISVGSLAAGATLSWHDPIYRVRATGTGTAYMLEEQSDRIEK